MNEFSKPLSAIWRTAESSKFQNKDGRPLTRSQSSPAEQVLNNVRSAQPYSNVHEAIIFPSKTFNNPNHFLVWSNGRTPLTHRLFSAVFVDARSGQVASISPMPLQLRILQLSRPLHFGDYGGLPLKILWACLDVIAMLVLISGILLNGQKEKINHSERISLRPSSWSWERMLTSNTYLRILIKRLNLRKNTKPSGHVDGECTFMANSCAEGPLRECRIAWHALSNGTCGSLNNICQVLAFD